MIHHPLPIREAAATPRRARVDSLMLALTDDCNLRCTYCFVKKTPRTMTHETARKAVDWLLRDDISGSGPITITFFGGEPMMRPELMETVIERVRSAGSEQAGRVRFSATTNGTIAGPRVERLVKDAQMELLISLDGDEAANRARPFVSGRPSYAVVARNVSRLASWASLAIVRVTYHPDSLAFVASAQRAFQLGAPSVVLAPVVESDWRGSEGRLEQTHQDLADYFIAEARRGRMLPLLGTWVTLRTLDHVVRGGGPPDRPCQVGTGHLAVDPDGNVMPCHRFLYRPQDWLGTVEDATLSPQRSRYLELSSYDFLECRTCDARPVCGGGCRSVALGAGLGLHGIHPGYCLTMLAHARATYRIYDTLMAERNQLFRETLRAPHGVGPALRELALS